MKRVPVVVLALWAIGYSSLVGAVGDPAQSLGNHHMEMTLTLEPGVMMFIPIPRQNFPINVYVAIPRFVSEEPPYPNAYGPFVLSVITADVQGFAFYPESESLYECPDPATFDASTLFWIGGDITEAQGCADTIDAFTIGAAQPVQGMPNCIMLGIINPSRDGNGVPLYGPVTAYVSMWY